MLTSSFYSRDRVRNNVETREIREMTNDESCKCMVVFVVVTLIYAIVLIFLEASQRNNAHFGIWAGSYFGTVIFILITLNIKICIKRRRINRRFQLVLTQRENIIMLAREAIADRIDAATLEDIKHALTIKYNTKTEEDKKTPAIMNIRSIHDLELVIEDISSNDGSSDNSIESAGPKDTMNRKEGGSIFDIEQPFEDSNVCIICFEIMEQPIILDCNHKFHTNCLAEWLLKNAQKTCPVCREPNILRKKDIVFNRTNQAIREYNTSIHFD